MSSSDPLINQIVHFEQVIRGVTEPLVTGEEGLKTLSVVEAIQVAAQTQQTVTLTGTGGTTSNAAE